MISIDTNLLFHAFNADSPLNHTAYDWLASLGHEENVVISEFVLAELYRLVRNPTVTPGGALEPAAAVELVESYRQHPRWMLVGFPENSRGLHDQLWSRAGERGFAYRRLFDVRTALTLIEHGVTDFATTNVRDFECVGFLRVWNPLAQ